MGESSETGQRTYRPGEQSAARAGVEAVLWVVHPPEVAGPIPLEEPRTVLGRIVDGEAHPRLGHRTVSRRHLAVEWVAGRGEHTAEDLGSSNGSWVDGRRLKGSPRPLVNGSVLRLGDVILVYEQGLALPPEPDGVGREAVPGLSRAARSLRVAVARLASQPAPVLLVGEAGVGKETIARELHRLTGRAGPLVAVSCTELEGGLAEHQLFGTDAAGAEGTEPAPQGFVRAATGGTLFLDEVGALPLALQERLLHLLQEREGGEAGGSEPQPDLHLVTTTQHDLGREVDRQTFNRELHALLSLWELRVPSLVDRRADLLDWYARLYRRWAAKRRLAESQPVPELETAAAEALLLAAWPDNLRGLDRVVHRLAVGRLRPQPVTLQELEPLLPVVKRVDHSDEPAPTMRLPIIADHDESDSD